jgi:peptide deformylase
LTSPGSFGYYFIGDALMIGIITLGDELLKRKSSPVPDIDGSLGQLVGEMFESLIAAKGVGLAAVQVGRLIRLFVTKAPKDSPRVFINPDILETSIDQDDFEEGCLSIPGINADVRRPSSVRIQAWNEKGKPFTLSADSYLARIIQHEMDHLNGILFIDHLDKKKKAELIADYQGRARL